MWSFVSRHCSKGRWILINKKGRNYQKGVPLSTICGIKWKNLRRIILSQKLGEDKDAVSKIVKHYTSHLDGETSKFNTWNSDVWRHVKTCFARVSLRVDAIHGSYLIRNWISPCTWPPGRRDRNKEEDNAFFFFCFQYNHPSQQITATGNVLNVLSSGEWRI